MKTYVVRLESHLSGQRCDPNVAALYVGPIYVWVRADTADYAVLKAQAMVPWRLVSTFSATEMLPGDII